MEFYRMQYTVAPTDVDRYGRLKPSMALLYIQTVSELHSSALSFTYESLAAQGVFWAVIRNRVQITRLPKKGEVITLETWPMPTTRVAYPRATMAYDGDGNELFRSTCLWILMDLKNRSMLLPKKSGVVVDGIVRGGELEPPASLLPKELSQCKLRQVSFTDLDCNGHTNNAKYLDWIADLLPSTFHESHPVQEMTLCYINESREGEGLALNWDIDEAGCLMVDIHREKQDIPGDYDRIFAAKIKF